MGKLFISLYLLALSVLAVPATSYAQTQDSTIKEIIVAFLFCEQFEKFTTLAEYGEIYKIYVDNGASYRTIVLSMNDPKIRLMRWGEVGLYKDDWIVVESISVKRNKAVIKAVHWIWNHGQRSPLKKGEIYMKRRKGKWEVTGTTLL